MNKTTTLNVRVTPEVKRGAEKVLSQLGLPMSTAIEMYLKQIAMTGGIPFLLTVPEDFGDRDVAEMGKTEENPYVVESEQDLLEAFDGDKAFILIKDDYEQAVKALLRTKLSDEALLGLEMRGIGQGTFTGELAYQFINYFSKKGTKERKKLESKIRFYSMKRNDEGEMLLYWRQLDY